RAWPAAAAPRAAASASRAAGSPGRAPWGRPPTGIPVPFVHLRGRAATGPTSTLSIAPRRPPSNGIPDKCPPRRFLGENRCNRSFAWVSLPCEVAAETPGGVHLGKIER